MNLIDLVQILTEAGLHTKQIVALTMDIEGVHVADAVLKDDVFGKTLTGNMVMISRENDQAMWVAESSGQGKLCESDNLTEIMESVLAFYHISEVNL